MGKGKFKKFLGKAAKFVKKAMPLVKLASGIIPGGSFITGIVDKAIGPLTKLGGAMKKVKGIKTLVGAIGTGVNPPQTVNPLMFKQSHPSRAIGALRSNMVSGSMLQNIAAATMPDYEGEAEQSMPVLKKKVRRRTSWW